MIIRTPAVLGLAFAALAISTAAAAPTATAPGWTVDKDHSTLGFEGIAQGDSFAGTFGKWDAKILFDPDHLGASQASVTVDTASAWIGEPDKDDPLQEDSWLGTATYPTATFTTGSIKPDGPGKYLADGTLTIRGVSEPVSLPFTLAIDGDSAKMAGSLTLDRTAFGIGAGAWQDHSVDNSVTVKVELTATRAD